MDHSLISDSHSNLGAAISCRSEPERIEGKLDGDTNARNFRREPSTGVVRTRLCRCRVKGLKIPRKERSYHSKVDIRELMNAASG